MRAICVGYLTICGGMLLAAPVLHAQQPLVRTQPFAPGQSVRMDVNVGDVHIVPSPDDRQLRLVIHPQHEQSSAEVQSWVRQFDVTGSQANIRLHMPIRGDNGGSVTLYVPSSTALNIDLGVGDLSIDRISGDKDVNMHIGDLKIDGLTRSDFGNVELSTGIGDVNDSIFSAQQSGWLGKSEAFQGSGKYHLRAHLGIGDIRLQTKGTWRTD